MKTKGDNERQLFGDARVDKERSVDYWKNIIERTVDGEREARALVSGICHPLIDFQTNRFCRRYCSQNKYQYNCTLSPPAAGLNDDAVLCEWGNASYAWMLDDLGSDNRLKAYRGENGASLRNYLYFIVNSRPFYERWKNWRFGRRIHVPSYIEKIDEKAKQVFLALRAGDGAELIAQNLGLSIGRAQALADLILIELTKRKRLYLLDPPKTNTFSELQSSDSEDGDQSFGEVEGQQVLNLENEALLDAWQKLSGVEQFVLEAMLVDEQEAEDVLFALRKMKIELKKGLSPEKANKQHLYYFKRKCLAKLHAEIS